MPTRHKIIIGDSRRMGEIADESVHLIVTSPPYWQLKDYGAPGQIGFDQSYEQYINNLNLVWNECGRVLNKGCRLCVNIGDQFARSAHYGRYKVIPIRTEIIKFCESIGFDYMGAIIWRKVTTCNTTGGATVMGSFPYPRNGVLKLDYEFILIFKKLGKSPKASKKARERSRLSTEEWNRYFSGHWDFPGEKQSGHMAMFPEELPGRLIRMFSFVGDTVLDPFLGSGTTLLVAARLCRNSVGYEINPDFLPVMRERMAIGEDGKGVDGAAFEIVETSRPLMDFEREIADMLYTFRDTSGLERKVDPRRRHFGSRIGSRRRAREKYHTVKKVLSPEMLELDSGRRVRLIGIKPVPGKKREAVSFLREKTRGAKIFLRYDPDLTDLHGARPAYVYLSNRTFLNAHLIKRGLADVDASVDFKHRRRFLEYRRAHLQNA